ncbi:hypothetical protein HZA98_04205 [Candidatus Woesearchaeota archaeon]|nr:hypothetical protein [Candidatus Woesearchaeota archaeon]
MDYFGKDALVVVNTSFVPLFLDGMAPFEQSSASLQTFWRRLERIGESSSLRFVALFYSDSRYGDSLFFYDFFSDAPSPFHSYISTTGRLEDGRRLSTALEDIFEECKNAYPLRLIIEFSPSTIYRDELDELVCRHSIHSKLDIEPFSLGENCKKAWEDLTDYVDKEIIRKIK